MNLVLARLGLFASGFALWTAFSIHTGANGGFAIREGWDGALYWQAGVPLLFAAQIAIAAFSAERPARAPLWIVAGHFAAMLLVKPAGTDLGLLPLALIFVGLPGYGALYLAALLGRGIGGRLR